MAVGSTHLLAAHTELPPDLAAIPKEYQYLSKRTISLGNGMSNSEFASMPAHPAATSPLASSFQQSRGSATRVLHDDGSDSRRSTLQQLEGAGLQRTASSSSVGRAPSRSNTLRKQRSVSRKGSLKRSSSRRSARAGSIGGITYDDTSGVDFNSVFYTPVPTSGSPTEILANRFQAWRKFLKDLIVYFREVQSSYEARAKALSKVSNTIQHLSPPPLLMPSGGLIEAHGILRDYHKKSVQEASKARDIENDVIAQLSGLRADLAQKIKEIKSLSGDFKNSVEKEKEGTKKAINTLQEALAAVDSDSQTLVGKEDPYIVRLAVERQVERQIDEENYLHRAYLNLEGSGRELESIVVGEVQKAYNALATIMKKEAEETHETVEKLRSGPISIPKDLEWANFAEREPHFVNPNTPIRRVEDLEYPGKFHLAAAEVRAGMLERKSKYLKSYTPGWYVLSPTHLHEFKSADGLYTQSPVMSLYLLDQKLGAHSQPGSSSHKFILKGRQTGSMHRGHSWVFRAESYDTMLAWYDNIKTLTEKTGEDRNNFVRRHTRSFSRNSATSVSSLEEDEADTIPYSGTAALVNGDALAQTQPRPQPGGRFPSDVQVTNLPARVSPSSDEAELHHLTSEHENLGYQTRGGIQGQDIYTSSFSQGPNPYYSSTEPQKLNNGIANYGTEPNGTTSTADLGSLSDKAWMTPAINTVSTEQTPNGALGDENSISSSGFVQTGNPWKSSEVADRSESVDTTSIQAQQANGYSPAAGIVSPTVPATNAKVENASSTQTNHQSTANGTTNEKLEGPISRKISRVNTDSSVSNLHVPGGFPTGASA